MSKKSMSISDIGGWNNVTSDMKNIVKFNSMLAKGPMDGIVSMDHVVLFCSRFVIPLLLNATRCRECKCHIPISKCCSS